jgi:hypothetical protein
VDPDAINRSALGPGCEEVHFVFLSHHSGEGMPVVGHTGSGADLRADNCDAEPLLGIGLGIKGAFGTSSLKRAQQVDSDVAFYGELCRSDSRYCFVRTDFRGDASRPSALRCSVASVARPRGLSCWPSASWSSSCFWGSFHPLNSAFQY